MAAGKPATHAESSQDTGPMSSNSCGLVHGTMKLRLQTKQGITAVGSDLVALRVFRETDFDMAVNVGIRGLSRSNRASNEKHD